MEKVTVLVAGCGSIGLRHLRNFVREGSYCLLAFDVSRHLPFAMFRCPRK